MYDSRLLHNSLLSFDRHFNEDQGELRGNKRTAYYNGLRFDIYLHPNTSETSRIYISGSIHKYYNNGQHNFNDFNIEMMRSTIQQITSLFSLDPRECKWTQLEIGVNITPKHNAINVLKGFISHVKKPFLHTYVPGNGNYFQVEHSDYFLKLYDKAMQYRAKGYSIESDILRLEIKYRNRKRLKSYNCKTLYDIMNTPLSVFIEDFIEVFSKSLFYDYTITKNSKQTAQFRSKEYWEYIIANRSSSTYKKKVNQLRDLTANYSEQVFNQLMEQCDLKMHELSNGGDRILSLYIEGNQTPQPRVCCVTGLNISMQKKSSIMLSHAGLKHYLATNPKLFKSLLYRFLGRNEGVSDYESLIPKIAHQIRNVKSNREQRIKRNYNPSQTAMQLRVA